MSEHASAIDDETDSDDELNASRKDGNATVLSSGTHVTGDKKRGPPKPTLQERPLKNIAAFVHTSICLYSCIDI